MKTPDYSAIRKHSAKLAEKMYEHLDRNRSLYADIAREFYPLGIAGWTKEVDDIADNEMYDEDHRLLTDMPVICHKKGSSGFNANLTSPARPWFRLKNPAFKANATNAEKTALDTVAETAAEVLSRSNAYKALAKLYDHVLCFGFGCMLVTHDDRSVVNVRTLRSGTYALGVGNDGLVNRCVRKFA